MDELGLVMMEPQKLHMPSAWKEEYSQDFRTLLRLAFAKENQAPSIQAVLRTRPRR
jgi:hypothetical protein